MTDLTDLKLWCCFWSHQERKYAKFAMPVRQMLVEGSIDLLGQSCHLVTSVGILLYISSEIFGIIRAAELAVEA